MQTHPGYSPIGEAAHQLRNTIEADAWARATNQIRACMNDVEKVLGDYDDEDVLNSLQLLAAVCRRRAEGE